MKGKRGRGGREKKATVDKGERADGKEQIEEKRERGEREERREIMVDPAMP